MAPALNSNLMAILLCGFTKSPFRGVRVRVWPIFAVTRPMPVLGRHQQEKQKRHEHERDQIHRQKDLHIVSMSGGIPCCLSQTYSSSSHWTQATTCARLPEVLNVVLCRAFRGYWRRSAIVPRLQEGAVWSKQRLCGKALDGCPSRSRKQRGRAGEDTTILQLAREASRKPERARRPCTLQ